MTMASTISLMPGRQHVAKHALGKERGSPEQSEGHEQEAGQGRQLEFDDGDEELDGEHEEGEQHDALGQHENNDGDEVFKEAGEANQLSGFLQEGARP